MEEIGWRQMLTDATERVQLIVSGIAISGDRGLIVGTGASGDKTLLADKEAEDELLRALSRVDGLRVLSEEAGNRGTRGSPLLALLDPVDGSSNLERGIPFYCTSIAVAKGTRLSEVSVGLVRNLVTGDVYYAETGKGATKNGRSIHTSRTANFEDAVAGVDLSRASPGLVEALADLVTRARRQVHYGANALELCYLAEGRIDALVDLRGRMRVTDFAAAYLIATEAGAKITSERGKPLELALELATKFSFVASANTSIHKQVLELTPSARKRPSTRSGS